MDLKTISKSSLAALRSRIDMLTHVSCDTISTQTHMWIVLVLYYIVLVPCYLELHMIRMGMKISFFHASVFSFDFYTCKPILTDTATSMRLWQV